jgi:hypothetical protein
LIRASIKGFQMQWTEDLKEGKESSRFPPGRGGYGEEYYGTGGYKIWHEAESKGKP